jgi:hypothetical protein
MLKSISTLRILGATGLLALASGCSKPAPSNPCDLLTVNEAQALDRTIAKTQWLPAKKGESDELCEYRDANGEQRLALFVRRGGTIDPLAAVKEDAKAGDKPVPVGGIGEKAAAVFASGGDVLKLFAASSKGTMIGIRARDPVILGDERFEVVKTLATKAVGRVK